MLRQIFTLFATVAVTGIVISILQMGFARELSVAWLAASPVVGVLLTRTLLPWFVRPFKVRQMLSSELSQAQRLSLAMMTATTILPLGGLAIPFWILARRRLWSSPERLLPDGLCP
jgi:hypothetical protein